MRLRYVYSACVVVETSDVRILCDPWFTPGIYDGAWYQYPVIADPIAAIGPVDLIWISHIHPDHYDAAFLRRFLAVHPARVLIGPQRPPHLANKMRIDGFTPEIAETLSIGGTDLLIVPNESDEGPISEIDSALVVRAEGRSVVNMNDNPVCPHQIARIRAFCPEGRVDFALLPYSGAGPYPQTFDFADEQARREAAERKKAQFLGLFEQYLEALDPVRAMPFAGKYHLGGRLRPLNPYRGVPDAMAVKARHGDRVVVLADGGSAAYDLATGIASAARAAPYDQAAIDAALAPLDDVVPDWENEIRPLPGHALPLLPLLTAAKQRARARVPIAESLTLVIRPDGEKQCFTLDIADDTPPKRHPADAAFEAVTPRLEIRLDARYLFGLLTRLYHWNNAEVGSQYRSRRVPDVYRAEVYQFLQMFQV
jgi:UDP-MurNAc hydroxylase